MSDWLRAFEDGDNEAVLKFLKSCQLKDFSLTYRYKMLRYSARNGWLDVLQELITKYNFNPSDTDCGVTALHEATYCGHLNIVQYLIAECGCDAMRKTNSGSTSLRMACSGGHFDIVKYLIDECKCDMMCRDNDGWLPIHSASYKGHMDIVLYLIGRGCDPMCSNKFGNTPLHEASYSGHLNIVQHLVTKCHCDPMCRNKAFSTPLHKACECSCVPVIEYLLSTGRVDPVARDMLLRQPLALVKDCKDEVQRVFAKFSRMKTTHPVSTYVKIVLLGNPGAGKSSLAQVIIQRSTSHLFTSARRLFQEVKAVEPCTAGIIPSKLEHKELGDIILHDLAGQPEYYSSHIAVLEDLLHSSPAVFIVVVNLSDGDAVFKHFHQWLNVVENESQKASANSHIIIVASHIDKINQKDLLPYFSSKLNAILLTRFHHHSISSGGLVALDCRKTAGVGLSLLVKKLASACESVRSINTTEANLLCRMLYTLLTDRRDTSYRLDKLMAISEAAEGYFLPQKREELIEALSTLHSFGLITFLKNVEVPDYSWIIVQRAILLTEVNGVLFAPNDVQQHCDVASNTGELYNCHNICTFKIHSLLNFECMM